MRPLFVFSLPRSGSTLVQRVLGAHPDIATAAEPHILLPVLYATRTAGARADYWHESAAEAIGDFIEQLDGGREAWLEEVGSFARALYQRAGGAGHTYFLDKTPRYHHIASEIMEAFPDGRFIFLWRHPLAVVSSCLDTFRAGRFEPYHFKSDVYDGMCGLLAAHARADERALSVGYEQLVSGGPQAWASIFSHLELAFDPELVGDSLPARPQGRYGDPTGGERYDGIATGSVDRWRQSMRGPVRAAWCRRYLHWIGAEQMTRMGYDLDAALAEIDGAGMPSVTDARHLLRSHRAAARRARALALPEGPSPLGDAFAAPTDALKGSPGAE